MGTSKQTVSRIETGKREWGKGYIEGFAHIVGCHPLAPLLAPPDGEFDVSALLKVIEDLGGLGPERANDAVKVLRSLVQTSTPRKGRAAKARPRAKA